MISFVATLKVKAGQAAAFEDAMKIVVPKVRQEPGNHAYIFHRSATTTPIYFTAPPLRRILIISMNNILTKMLSRRTALIWAVWGSTWLKCSLQRRKSNTGS